MNTACNSKRNNQQSSEVKADEPFYPYPQYLKDELNYIDSMPLAIEYIKTVNGKRIDSNYLDKTLFRNMVNDWINEDPNSSSLKNKFTENSFEDLTLNRVTFSITAQTDDTKLRQADILLNPDNKAVKTVILKRTWNQADSAVIQTIMWTNHMKCQVAETITKNDSSYQRIQQFVWDKPL